MNPQNWNTWAQIEPNIISYCRMRWREPATAADVLSGGRLIFVTRHRGGDYPLPRLVRFGQLCCRRAADKQRYGRIFELSGWDELPETRYDGHRRGLDYASDMADLSRLDAELLRRESRLQALERALASWAAGGSMEAVVRLHLSGKTGREVAQELGMHPSQVTRRLQDMGRKLGAQPRQRRQVEAAGQQMGLFSGQGV